MTMRPDRTSDTSNHPDSAAVVVERLRDQAFSLVSEMLGLLVRDPGAARVVERAALPELHHDLLTVVMRAAVSASARARGLSVHGGQLFDSAATPWLAHPTIARAIEPVTSRAEAVLSFIESPDGRIPIAYDRLPVEIVGSVYEGLISHDIEHHEAGLRLSQSRGRKRSGSYYTPGNITAEVARRALAPTLARVSQLPPEQRAQVWLALRICDPAMGAGAFLIEATRQLAESLTTAWSNEESPRDLVAARRAVVTQCLYGCDINPLAVAVTEASLWLLVGDQTLPVEAAGAGLHHGDALIGLLHDEVSNLTVARPNVRETTTLDEGAAVARCRDTERLRAAATHVVRAILGSAKGGRRAASVGEIRRDAMAILERTPSPSSPDVAAQQAFQWGIESPPAAEGGAAVQIRRSAEGTPPASTDATALPIFHWGIDSPPAARGGFDIVIGNPPWVAFAGRAAQPLDPKVRSYFKQTYDAWKGYPTLHGLFIERAARLAPHGVIALVVPSPIADLDGYRGVRRALTRRHAVREPLLEFGQDAFDDVVQPCIALVADPAASPRPSDEPWRLEERQRATTEASTVAVPSLFNELAQLPPLPPDVFREMGFQTTSEVTRTMLRRTDHPNAEHWVPLLEGRNVREFHVGTPQLYLDASADQLRRAQARLRPLTDYASVDVVIRQTAVAPIAAPHTGLPFRNTLLAAFARDGMSTELLVGLLNSALYRAFHLAACRDARQAVFPQVKIRHLRRLPCPPQTSAPQCVERRLRVARCVARLIAAAPSKNAADLEHRRALDEAVFDLFGTAGSQRDEVRAFLAVRAPNLGYDTTS